MRDHQSVVGIIFSKDRKKVLLLKRRDVPVWVLPGGGVENTESLEKAVLREVWEETGLQTRLVRKVGEYSPLNRLARHTHLYECEGLSGKLTTGEETREIQFFPLDQLPKLLPPPYPEWIKEAYQKLPLIKRSLTSVNYTNFCRFLIFHPILVIRFLLQRLGVPFNSK